MVAAGGKGPLIQENKSATLSTNNDQTLFEPVVMRKSTKPHSKDEVPTYKEDTVSNTLNVFDNGENRANELVLEPKAYRICGKYSNSMLSDNPNSGCYEAKTGITLDTSSQSPDKNQGGIMVLQQPAAYGIDRAAFNQGQNAQYKPQFDEEISQTVIAKGPNAVGQPIYHSTHVSFHCDFQDDPVVATLAATDHKDPPTVCESPEYIVRRLTPTECARLQGFPDWWCDDIAVPEPTEDDMKFWRGVFDTYCDINEQKHKTDNQIRKWLADPHTDSAEYKMWGNGVALPCVFFVMQGIAEELQKDIDR